MNTDKIIEQIREYTGVGYGIAMDDVLYTQIVVEGWLGFILGVMIWVIAVGMALVTAVDVAFITIPTFREIARRKRWDGTSERTRARLISNDARDAVEESCNLDESSALVLYLKKRAKTYIFVTVVVFVLAVGTNSIVQVASKIITGILVGAS